MCFLGVYSIFGLCFSTTTVVSLLEVITKPFLSHLDIGHLNHFYYLSLLSSNKHPTTQFLNSLVEQRTSSTLRFSHQILIAMLYLVCCNINILTIHSLPFIPLSNVFIHQYTFHQFFSWFLYTSQSQFHQIPFIANSFLPTHLLSNSYQHHSTTTTHIPTNTPTPQFLNETA